MDGPTLTVAGRLETVWELVTSGPGSARWLGNRSSEPLRASDEIRFGGRDATVTAVRPAEHVVELTVAGAPVTVRLTGREVGADGGPGRSVVIDVIGAAEADRAAWTAALGRAHRALRDARQHRDPRQAIVLIHGIGEQLPGTTVRGFAQAAIAQTGSEVGDLLHKPDARLRPLYELVRLQAFKDDGRDLPRTDFFELYWQDLIRDTTFEQVKSWGFSLLQQELPPKFAVLRRIARIGAFLLVLAAIFLLVAVLVGVTDISVPSWWSEGSVWITLGLFVASAVAGAATAWAVSSLGDVARYVRPLPDNLAVRQAVRDRGVAMLRDLHADGEFQRVVVVGHSLGSLIALDIVTEYWWEVFEQPGAGSAAALAGYEQALTAFEAAAEAIGSFDASSPATAAGLDAYRDSQARLWQAMRGVGLPWLVTDLVTLGSPLQYPWPLLAKSSADFEARQAELLVPAAPPRPDVARRGSSRGITFPSIFESPDGPTEQRLLHQGAVLAPTRWTNVFFPSPWWLFGDPVGGPVRERFGPGVRDRRLAPEGSWLGRHSPKLHSQYWSRAQGDAMAALGEALQLTSLDELKVVAAERPLSTYLET